MPSEKSKEDTTFLFMEADHRRSKETQKKGGVAVKDDLPI